MGNEVGVGSKEDASNKSKKSSLLSDDEKIVLFEDVSLPNDLDGIVDIDIPAIGIDLGTTFSCAAVYTDKKSEIVENRAGDRLTPSLIYYHPDISEVSCGKAAYDASLVTPSNFLFDMKRLIGRQFNDAYVQQIIKAKSFPFKVVQGKEDKAEIELVHNGKTVRKSPEQVCSEILTYIRESACEKLGPVSEAVISVPARFSEAQRKATKEAAELAGFKVLRLVSEPVAAAIHYAKERLKDDVKLMVFDFGGGTLDVSFIEVQNNKFTVKCVEGDTFLGGRDFDEVLVSYFKTDMIKKFGKKMMTPRLTHRLKRNCEKLKHNLSFNTTCELPALELPGDKVYSITLTRHIFEDLAKNLIDRAMYLIESCLREAKINKNDIDKLILVGGSTRIPKIRERLTTMFGKNKIKMDANADEAVALGAAVLAALLKGKHSKLEVVEVTPLSLGTNVGHKLMSTIIKRNTPLPAQETKVYITCANDQENCEIKIFEGERKNCDHNNLLGYFKVRNLPPGKAGSVKISVNFNLDENGILKVIAEENSTGTRNDLVVNVENLHMCENEIQTLITTAEANSKSDFIFEKFSVYELETNRYLNHVLFHINKVDPPFIRKFVIMQITEYYKNTKDLAFTKIDRLKAEFEKLRESIEVVIEEFISTEGYIPSDVFIPNEILESLNIEPLTFEDMMKLYEADINN